MDVDVGLKTTTGTPPGVDEFRPDASEATSLASLVQHVSAAGWVDESGLLDYASTITADQLPERLELLLQRLIRGESQVLVVRALSHDPVKIPATPSDYTTRTEYVGELRVAQAILLSRLGYPFGFAKQQFGRVFNDIVPVERFQEVANISGGTRHRFDFHTEDAFHPARPQWFSLVAIRNTRLVPTQLAIPDVDRLSQDCVRILGQPLFKLGANPMQGGPTASPAESESVIFPGRIGPAFRFNFCFEDAPSLTTAQSVALAELYDELQQSEFAVTLSSGDCLLFDNERVFHAREPYEARFDGGDRWLSRAVAADAKSRLDGFFVEGSSRSVAPVSR